jgi:hypothetical protein
MGSDFPHGEGTPQPSDYPRALKGLDEVSIRRIINDNGLALSARLQYDLSQSGESHHAALIRSLLRRLDRWPGANARRVGPTARRTQRASKCTDRCDVWRRRLAHRQEQGPSPTQIRTDAVGSLPQADPEHFVFVCQPACTQFYFEVSRPKWSPGARRCRVARDRAPMANTSCLTSARCSGSKAPGGALLGYATALEVHRE